MREVRGISPRKFWSNLSVSGILIETICEYDDHEQRNVRALAARPTAIDEPVSFPRVHQRMLPATTPTAEGSRTFFNRDGLGFSFYFTSFGASGKTSPTDFGESITEAY